MKICSLNKLKLERGVLGSCGLTTRRSSSSPFRLLRSVQTVPLESTKGDYDVQEEEQVEDGNAFE
ncbi:hypothetical protein Taro_042637 [Colocasia esculenta]|uniref:Uncharacterized protein n=1 Tax=Colocasia esculenta TaxID=4460 RepID=A0A843WX12_COLES|nr:hypothetical protein [Colocasia esculenta]